MWRISETECCYDPDRYPIPHIDNFLKHLQGSNLFSKIDLVRAHCLILMSSEDLLKTAITIHFGLVTNEVANILRILFSSTLSTFSWHLRERTTLPPNYIKNQKSLTIIRKN